MNFLPKSGPEIDSKVVGVEPKAESRSTLSNLLETPFQSLSTFMNARNSTKKEA